MQRPTNSLRAGGTNTLPSPYRFMDRRGWKLRLGSLVIVASAPKTGKTAVALDICRRLHLRTLIISADTDENTMAQRLASQVTGRTMVDLEDDWDAVVEAVRDQDWLWFGTPNGAPTLEDIDEEVRAFAEAWGAPPEVIVIDNLINVQADDGDEFRGLRQITAALHQLARASGALVLALHHVTGEWEDGTAPPPRRALHGKISKLPEQVFTLGGSPGGLGVACVANRFGPSDPLAEEPEFLYTDWSVMRVSEDA